MTTERTERRMPSRTSGTDDNVVGACIAVGSERGGLMPDTTEPKGPDPIGNRVRRTLRGGNAFGPVAGVR